MEPYPKHCFICGREIGAGIDAHVRSIHKMDYDTYRKWFRDAKGSYSVFEIGKDRVILTVTRDLRPV